MDTTQAKPNQEKDRLPEKTRSAGPRHWFAGQVVKWIAYGSAPVPTQDPVTVWGYNPPQVLMDVLAARVDRKVWQPSDPLPDGQPYHYRARAKRIMRETSRSASDVLQAMRGDKAFGADRHKQTVEALLKLNQAVEAGEVTAEGRPTDSLSTPRSHRVYEKIPPHFIDSLRTITACGEYCIHGDLPGPEWHHDEGPFFHDVRFLITDVQRQWPDRAASCHALAPTTSSSPPVDAPTPTARKRKHPGRDWRAGDAPLVQEMRRMIDAKEATSATDAALAVVGQAKGIGKLHSKVARLVTRYGETYPAM